VKNRINWKTAGTIRITTAKLRIITVTLEKQNNCLKSAAKITSAISGITSVTAGLKVK
jgi:hypothetical protein